MKHTLQLVMLGVIGGNIFWNSWQANEASPIVYAQEPEAPRVVQIAVKIDWTPERIEKEVRNKTTEYGVSFEEVWSTIKCENPSLDPGLQSYHVKDGEREDSWGLAQIHLPSHPEITKEQATDPAFAIDYIAKGFQSGDEWMWTCARKLGYVE